MRGYMAVAVCLLAAAAAGQAEENIWFQAPALRETPSGLGDVLADIESHIAPGHIYSNPQDKVNWAHETVHGVNAALHGKHILAFPYDTAAFYCLEDKVAIVRRPATTTIRAAGAVPLSLRGEGFQYYLVTQSKQFFGNGMYVLEEWHGYISGTHAGLDLLEKKAWTQGYRANTVAYMTCFNVYALAMASTVTGEPDPQLQVFMRWNLARALDLLAKSKDQPMLADPAAELYWRKFQTATDAEPLRTFTRKYLGAAWCKEVLGI